jgi:hypothetical protein
MEHLDILVLSTEHQEKLIFYATTLTSNNFTGRKYDFILYYSLQISDDNDDGDNKSHLAGKKK